jgi:hypothetical protein
MADERPVLQLEPQPLTITIKGIRSIEESDESSASDEIYVLVTAVDLTVQPLPNVRTVLTGVWGDVDEGEFHNAVQFPPGTTEQVLDSLSSVMVVARPFWGLDLRPHVIRHQDNVIFLVSCMEHDEGSVQAMREIVQVAATASVASSIGMARSALVRNLINDIDGALRGAIAAIHPNQDEQVGRTRELRLTPSHVVKAMAHGEFEEALFFDGGDEGHVRVDFLFRS